MRTVLSLLALLTVTSLAHADPKCPTHPKSQWMPQDTLRKQLEGQGYQIKTFKVSGQCYEIYGKDKAGKKVEIYFDTVSGQPVKSKVES
ncbi:MULTISPECIES: PepSY domain-containing protein [Leeia]|uniref:PepSY domain-containing protein n=1 Tax=Leeia aquatica TaxID=2725557 RepID=A0A847SBJ5_9NEIS|nr:PepSY domain-containing protein [Leeia aquatica]NLR74719.1 PepSY domain-containing protein [Leeia aquatica]